MGSVLKMRLSSFVVFLGNEEDGDGDNDDVPKPSIGITKKHWRCVSFSTL